jgi:hypothetical protein
MGHGSMMVSDFRFFLDIKAIAPSHFIKRDKTCVSVRLSNRSRDISISSPVQKSAWWSRDLFMDENQSYLRILTKPVQLNFIG